MSSTIPSDDDDDVMITEITSAPPNQFPEQSGSGSSKPHSFSSPTIAKHSSGKHGIPDRSNAINVLAKMGLKSASNLCAIGSFKGMQTVKYKRGPKEKTTFHKFIYCLPDQHATLPRLSSSDQKSVVEDHQYQGYGFPAVDYNDGFPKKSTIELGSTAQEFDKYLQTIYPKLSSRLFDVYKIDKQRRLLKLSQEQRIPRAIKDSKYQGTIIVIPYDSPNERPPSILYKNSNSVLVRSLIGEDGAQRNIDSPQQTPPKMSPSAFILPKAPRVSSPQQTPLNPSSSLFILPTTVRLDEPSSGYQQHPITSTNVNNIDTNEAMYVESMFIKTEKDESDGEMDTVVSSSKVYHSTPEVIKLQEEPDTSHSSKLKYMSGIFDRSEYLRSRLKTNAFHIHLHDADLVQSMLQVYGEFKDILNHKVVVCTVNHEHNDEKHQQNPIQPFYVQFWDQIFELYFEGNKEMVPLCSSAVTDDLFGILGRILYHGLVLLNYWPVRLSQACASIIMTGTSSDKQLTESFRNYLSESQNKVITNAKAEVRSGALEFSENTQRQICTALRTCGNSTVPEPKNFGNHLLKLAKFCFIQKPYWCLDQMKNGLGTFKVDFLEKIEEKDVFMFYSALSPSAITLFDKIVYLFSTCEDDPEIEMEEKRVKTYLENYVMQLTSTKLSKLLRLWSQSDCLNNNLVYVRFVRTSVSRLPIFESDGYTIALSSIYASQEEFSSIMSKVV